MTVLLDDVQAVLAGSGFEMVLPKPTLSNALAFESDTVLGFVIAYSTVADLLGGWRRDADEVALERRLWLRAAGAKAWNVYILLLAHEEASFAASIALGSIEEDLVGTRKIARAGVTSIVGIQNAILPLLPFGAAPVLEPIDMCIEIKARATELNQVAVDAFLSLSEQSVVLQMLEE